MTIKIIDKRSNREMYLHDFSVSHAQGSHLVFGWETYDHFYPDDANMDFYEVTFPEVEELKKENEEWRLNQLHNIEQLEAIIVEQKADILEAERLKQRIAELEKELASWNLHGHPTNRY